MLTHHTLQETDETPTEETSTAGSSATSTGTPGTEPQRTNRSARSRWAVAALLGFAALVIVIGQSGRDDADPGPVSDGSFETAEANRMNTLRDLTTSS